jgi:hypothetical protein
VEETGVHRENHRPVQKSIHVTYKLVLVDYLYHDKITSISKKGCGCK